MTSPTPPPPPDARGPNPPPPSQRRRQVQNWIVIGAVLIGGLIYLAHTRRQAEQNAAASGAPIGDGLLEGANFVGRRAPDWTLPAPDGKPVSLAQFAGHPIVLDFWATWCGPCQVELPWWKQLQEEYRAQGLVIIGVSEDASVKDVQGYLKTHAMNYPVVVDLGHLEASYGDPLGLPTTLFIRRDGTISARIEGLEDQPVLESHVKEIVD